MPAICVIFTVHLVAREQTELEVEVLNILYILEKPVRLLIFNHIELNVVRK